MNDNIDLTKILEGCPKGTNYIVLFMGKLNLKVAPIGKPFPIRVTQGYHNYRFSNYGRLYLALGQCILFPSKNQRD